MTLNLKKNSWNVDSFYYYTFLLHLIPLFHTLSNKLQRKTLLVRLFLPIIRREVKK